MYYLYTTGSKQSKDFSFKYLKIEQIFLSWNLSCFIHKYTTALIDHHHIFTSFFSFLTYCQYNTFLTMEFKKVPPNNKNLITHSVNSTSVRPKQRKCSYLKRTNLKLCKHLCFPPWTGFNVRTSTWQTFRQSFSKFFTGLFHYPYL